MNNEALIVATIDFFFYLERNYIKKFLYNGELITHYCSFSRCSQTIIIAETKLQIISLDMDMRLYTVQVMQIAV